MPEFTTFDDIAVRRPALAASYLQLLMAQPGRPIALFAPRRVGKTNFLDYDLTPAAVQAGFLPIYADVWLHRDAPLEAINHALEEALDDIQVPASSVSKIGKTSVKSVGALSVNLAFGDEPKRRSLPDEPAFRLDSLINRVASQVKRPILLMLDEIQALGESAHGKTIIASLRAVLQKRKSQVFGVFTGSSQEALTAMTVSVGAPMYQFTQMLDFPLLGDEYLDLLADHFRSVHKSKRLDIADLRSVFEHIGRKPALMKDIIKSMSAEGVTDIHFAMQRFMQNPQQVNGWQHILAALDKPAQAALIVMANGLPPLSKDAANIYQKLPGANITPSKVRTAMNHLRKEGLLTKLGTEYKIEDALFADYIASTAPLNSLVGSAPEITGKQQDKIPRRRK